MLIVQFPTLVTSGDVAISCAVTSKPSCLLSGLDTSTMPCVLGPDTERAVHSECSTEIVRVGSVREEGLGFLTEFSNFR